MNKFISLSVLMLGFLFAGSAATAMGSSAFNCVKGVVEGTTNTHASFNNCALSTNKALSNFERRTIKRYLTDLSEPQLENLATNVLGETISVDLPSRQEVILSVLDQVEYVSQPCSADNDKSANLCRKNRRLLQR